MTPQARCARVRRIGSPIRLRVSTRFPAASCVSGWATGRIRETSYRRSAFRKWPAVQSPTYPPISQCCVTTDFVEDKLMRFLRQSTASQEILLGPFVAAADGSAQTGLTIANTDI